MIINSHVHLNTDNKFFFYNDYGLNGFLVEMKQNGINIALPTLNPKLGIFRCPNDCSMHCPQTPTTSINNNLNECNCSNPNRHRVGIFEGNANLVLKCKTCGNIIFKSTLDPLHKYNVVLINLTKPYRAQVRPLLYISLCHSTIQSEINFFEKCYGNEFVGFKLHPWNDQISVADFRLHSSKPILIHTGLRNLESATNAVAFAENNPEVKIIIAHAAALDENCLRKIGKLKNVFVDCCPSVFMFKNRVTSLFNPAEITSPEDIYYKVLDFVPSDKILFGSDSPWGNSNDELSVISKLHISERFREQILYKNAVKVYEL